MVFISVNAYDLTGRKNIVRKCKGGIPFFRVLQDPTGYVLGSEAQVCYLNVFVALVIRLLPSEEDALDYHVRASGYGWRRG